jgi:acyl-CoA thioester hydrolase
MTDTHPHLKEIEIRWRDLDAFGHVNHASFVTFLEEGRDEWLDRATGSNDEAMSFVIRRVEIDYVSQLVLADDHVRVRVELERIGTSSLTTVEEMHVVGDGRLVARARCVLVYVGAAHEHAVPITPALRARFEPTA